MSTLIIYSSTPLNTPLAVAFYNLACLGLQVEVKPLSALPPGPPPSPRRSALYAELEEVSLELATLGERLSQHELGRWLLGAGEEQGLRARRDDLASRRRGLVGALRGLAGKGGLHNG